MSQEKKGFSSGMPISHIFLMLLIGIFPFLKERHLKYFDKEKDVYLKGTEYMYVENGSHCL